MADKVCEKCIHYDLCKSEIDSAPDDTFSFFPYNEDCPHFKNKADVVEVKHGEWKQGVPYVCSICGKPAPDEKNTDERYSCWLSTYCPNCGAKMDGEKEIKERF